MKTENNDVCKIVGKKNNNKKIKEENWIAKKEDVRYKKNTNKHQ